MRRQKALLAIGNSAIVSNVYFSMFWEHPVIYFTSPPWSLCCFVVVVGGVCIAFASNGIKIGCVFQT